MPERKRLFFATPEIRCGCSAVIRAFGGQEHKSGPEDGAARQKVLRPRHAAKGSGSAKVLLGSEPKVGELAVAHRRIGAAEQETVDRRQKAAKKTTGRGEWNRSGIGHFGLISGTRRAAASCSETNLGMPDASSNPFVCIAAFCLPQCNIKRTVFRIKKRPPDPGGLLSFCK